MRPKNAIIIESIIMTVNIKYSSHLTHIIMAKYNQKKQFKNNFKKVIFEEIKKKINDLARNLKSSFEINLFR